MKAYPIIIQEDKFLWFKKPKHKKLIVFFAGWSFDNNPFYESPEGSIHDYDVLMIYDYNDLSIPKPLTDAIYDDKYEEKVLIAWSMGVFVAYKFKDMFKRFDKRIAINGTVTPVDDNFGIPVKIFELTLKNAAKGLESGKFYRNLLNNDEEDWEIFNILPIERTIENRVSELENLYDLIKNEKELRYEKFYDIALVGDHDKIIPPENQKASHGKNNVKVVPMEVIGHFPFYSYNWDMLVNFDKYEL